MKTKTFAWRAIDSSGLCITGQSQAKNKKDLTLILQKNNITLLRAKQLWVHYLHARITGEDVTVFGREMAFLINAGIPVCNALQIIRKSVRKVQWQAVIAAMQKQVEDGSFFADALKTHPEFDAVFFNLVQAGEQSGTLDSALLYLAGYREKMQKLYLNVRKALIYPAIVLCVSLLVVGVLLTMVMPQFVSLFENVGMELPVFTQIVIKISAGLGAYGFYYFSLLVSVYFLLQFAAKRFLRVQTCMHKIFLQLPFVGRFLKHIILARSFRTLAMLLQAGIPLLDSLRLTAEIAGNVVFSAGFSVIADQVISGQSLSIALQQTQIFPERVMQVVHIGEESGCLDIMLMHLGEYFDSQVDYLVQHLTLLLEPVIMVFLSVVVGVLVVAMYLPIFHLGSVL